jgi:hypothetical protein
MTQMLKIGDYYFRLLRYTTDRTDNRIYMHFTFQPIGAPHISKDMFTLAILDNDTDWSWSYLKNHSIEELLPLVFDEIVAFQLAFDAISTDGGTQLVEVIETQKFPNFAFTICERRGTFPDIARCSFERVIL